MPLLDVQKRMRELGRIRLGEKRPAKSGKGSFPAKLTTFRLTSPSRTILEAMAAVHGGTVTKWDEPKVTGTQWQVTLGTDVLDVMVPPGQVGSQWWERWSADGCTRRCDGETDTVTGRACDCPPDIADRLELAKNGKACRPQTRLSLFLDDCPEVGVWVLGSTGMNAAIEMAAIANVCELATRQGRVVPAKLRMEQRSAKKPGQARSDFVVPVLDLKHGVKQIMEAFGMLDGDTFAPSLAAPPAQAALPEARPDLPPDPGFRTQGTGSVEALPPAPAPGPAPLTGDDDEVVEAEIVTDTADAEGAVEQPAAPSAGGDEIGSGSGTIAQEEASADSLPDPDPRVDPLLPDDSWSADQWKVEARVRGIQRRDLILKGREIAADNDLPSPSTFSDLTDPVLAPALRAWLLTKDTK
jgi:hypothetical protein